MWGRRIVRPRSLAIAAPLSPAISVPIRSRSLRWSGKTVNACGSSTSGSSTCRVTSPIAASSPCSSHVQPRRYISFGNQKETINPDEISFVDDVDAEHDSRRVSHDDGNDNGHLGGSLGPHVTACLSPTRPGTFVDVPKIDTFSRARVVNFIKRRSGSQELPSDFMTTTRVDTEGAPRFHCAMRLGLSHPSCARDGAGDGARGQLWAHGEASTAKDAEHLAAMHAERIIDELGLAIYQLPSMQRRHAEAARKSGRFATSPAPDSASADVSAPDTAGRVLHPENFPAPLRCMADEDETEKGRWQLLDSDSAAFDSPHLALLSSCVIDSGAEPRIRQFLKKAGLSADDLLETEFEEPSKLRAAAGAVSGAYITRLKLPATLFTDESGKAFDSLQDSPLIAEGKAPDSGLSVVLACMHAELILDMCRVCLFADAGRQKQHARLAWDFGRAAPLPGEPHVDPAHLSLPLPLKAVPAAGRVAPLHGEERLVHLHRMVSRQTSSFKDTTARETTAVDDLKEFLSSRGEPRAAAPFFHEQVGSNVKSSVVLPLPGDYGIRGGVGIAGNLTDADVLAAMHALDVLQCLGVPVKGGGGSSPSSVAGAIDESWKACRARELGETFQIIPKTAHSPPGRRCASGGFTRTFATTATTGAEPPKAAETGADASVSSGSGNSRPAAAAPKKARRVTKRAGTGTSSTAESLQPPQAESPHLRARQSAAREQWDLSADSPDGFIMVSPGDDGSSAGGTVGGSNDGDVFGRLAAFAIRSPRQIDTSARNRVRTYLDNIGRRYSDLFVSRKVADDADDDTRIFGESQKPLWRCAAPLPVPPKYGDRVAIGEGYSSADAEHLAAMHAELILDELGVCLFNNAAYQKQHVLACADSGRWAPTTEADARSADTPSPPPLRREYVGSLHWERQEERKRRQPTITVAHPEAVRGEPPRQEGVATAAANENGTAAAVNADYTDVRESELDPVSKNRVQYYLRRMGKTGVDEMVYSTFTYKSAIMHSATFQMPLPTPVAASDDTPTSGDTSVAVEGVATAKRDAEVLCWMHAERVLDESAIPIFDNLPKLQCWHSERVSELGRWAPADALPDGVSISSMPFTLAKVPPLRLRTSPADQVLEVPTPPAPDSEDWEAYVARCVDYIDLKRTITWNGHFDMERVPRTGFTAYDATLDEAETAPLEADAKLLLQLYCNAAGTEYPKFWKQQTVGPLMHRVQFVSASVPGWRQLTCQGVGANSDVAQKRAAMHALVLLKLLDDRYPEYMEEATSNAAATKTARNPTTTTTVPISAVSPDNDNDGNDDAENLDESELLPNKILPDKNRDSQKLSFEWDIITYWGQRRALELLCVSNQSPPPVLREMNRMNEDGTRTCWTVLSILDHSAGSEQPVLREWRSSTLRVQQAYLSMHQELMADPDSKYSSVVDLLRQHPQLEAAQVPQLTLSDAMQDRIRDLAAECEDTAEAERPPSESDELPAAFTSLADKGTEDVDEAARASLHGILQVLSMDASDKVRESQALLAALNERITNPKYLETFATQRGRLSIATCREAILQTLEEEQVLIICGTTGCGKTTQVPQFILDALTERNEGGECSILVTQPRRLSAVSIARRVAAERLEEVGENCGYVIRFDSRPGRHINFCTTGILLRLLHTYPLLEGINYLIIDEIHERDINSDFLLILLKDIVRRRKDLRVILMSATLQAEHFTKYFNNAPAINVQGHVFPVQELFLEDLARHAESHNVASPLLKEAAAVVRNERAAESDDKDSGDNYYDLLDSSRDAASGGSVGTTSNTGREKYGMLEVTTDIDYAAIQFAVEQAMRMVDLSQSSVLVFLPGWEEITRAKDMLQRNSSYHIICLHSSVGAEDQMQCFLPPPPGKVKVVLSTNIAESGITIDDVGAVIDVGRAKEKTYVMQRGKTEAGSGEMGSVSQLLTVYASHANCVQRRGRVGRTRPGVCIRLYSRVHFDHLHDFQTPEMMRTPLDSLCLQILFLRLGDPAEFLGKALEPPPAEQVELAISRLQDLGAVTGGRQLTPLGYRLSLLPVEPKVGKMILMGTIFRCLDSALLCAAATQSDVFANSREMRDAVRLYRQDFSKGTQSDLIAALNGYNYWVSANYNIISNDHNAAKSSDSARDNGGSSDADLEVLKAAQERMLSVPTLRMLARIKRQFYRVLQESGFIQVEEAEDALTGLPGLSGEPKAQIRRLPRDVFIDQSAYSSDARHVGLVKSVVATGYFPSIALYVGRKKLRTKLERSVQASADSVLHKTRPAQVREPYFVFSEKSKAQNTNRITVRGLSGVSLWAMLLLGHDSMPITYDDTLSFGSIDNWIFFRATRPTIERLQNLRSTLRGLLAKKYRDPLDEANNQKLERMRVFIRDLLSEDATLDDAQSVEASSIIDPFARLPALPSSPQAASTFSSPSMQTSDPTADESNAQEQTP